MTKKVVITRKVEAKEEKIKLCNGDLILVKDCPALMVVSYTAEGVGGRELSKHCCLVNLETGAKAFASPCPRHSTRLMIANYLADSYIFSEDPHHTSSEAITARVSKALAFERISVENYEMEITIVRGED